MYQSLVSFACVSPWSSKNVWIKKQTFFLDYLTFNESVILYLYRRHIANLPFRQGSTPAITCVLKGMK